MNFSERLKELREEKKITQKELAKYLGLTANSIGAWENGRSEPSINSILKMSALFEIPVSYLLGQTDEFGGIILPASSPAAESKEIMERPTSDVTENYIREFRELLSEEHFIELAKLYKAMDEAQRIYTVAYITGYLSRAGVDTQAILGK